MLENAISVINDSMYTLLIIPILLLGGIFFTVRTRAVQLARLGDCLRTVTDRPQSLGKTSSFQALMVSTASRVGTGNLIGVSTAICLGGFGSVFWMWVIAILGGATTFIESTLAQIYKRRGEDGESYGGASYYVEGALGSRPLAVVFSILLILTYGFGFNMLTSYNLASTLMPYPFYDPTVTPAAVGIILALFQWLNTYAISTMDGAFLFPLYSGGSILLSTLVGVTLFRDRLTARQRVSLFVGIVAVILMNF